MEQAKLKFVQQVEELATKLEAIKHQVEDVQSIWDSRLYGPGMADAFSDADLAVLDTMGLRSCKADDLYSFVIFCAQFQAFLHNQAPAVSDYNATLNKLRTDL